ncbi:MAG: glycoside hydrolase family 15 protein, partial [Gammaproteobacteria bacterium]
LMFQLADYWNANIENWTVARNTTLALAHQVPGYYVRESPVQTLQDTSALARVLPIKNRQTDPGIPAVEQIGVDFLQLVRFGLRSADDPLIISTLQITDALLKVETPSGPSWHRYKGDGYGEQHDGKAYDGTGIGRAWPLLTGERGHYELATGTDPLPYLHTMASMAGGLGMIPEQVWDTSPIPERVLLPGRPTGSAMPLAWAHAEFIKLAVSRHMQRIVDRPNVVWQRYHGKQPVSKYACWTPSARITLIAKHQTLVLLLPEAAVLHIGINGWQNIRDLTTRPSAVGLHYVEFHPELETHSIEFTWRLHSGSWHERDYQLTVLPRQAGAATTSTVANESVLTDSDSHA